VVHISQKSLGLHAIGVGRTPPSIAWFESAAEVQLWDAGRGKLTAEFPQDFISLWSRNQIVGRLAEERSLQAVSHLRTENVARDMLRITEAHGFEKLQYWGLS
jgi:hypothetical protein